MLAAHPGPEISAACAASLAALPADRTRAALTELTLANLLRESTPGRYAFHDLVRQYATEQLAADAGAATARLIHHYVRSTREAFLLFGRPPVAPLGPELTGVIPERPASMPAAVRWYVRERSVLRAVVRRALVCCA